MPFASYATTRIRGAVARRAAQRRLGLAARSAAAPASLDETRNQLATALGRIPTHAEVASALGLSADERGPQRGRHRPRHVLSIQGSERPTSSSCCRRPPTPAEQCVEHRERLTYMVEAVAELPERLRAVVEQYFLARACRWPRSPPSSGVSESRVSQMRAEALVLLRGALDRALEPEPVVAARAGPEGCAARRREAYYAAVAARHASRCRRPVARPCRLDAIA